MEQRNFFQIVYDLIMSQADRIKDNIESCREMPERRELVRLWLGIAGSVIVLAVMLSSGIVVLRFVALLIMEIYNFLILPQHRALFVIARGLIAILIVALIINTFIRKPKGLTEREEDAIKKTLTKDLLPAVQNLSSPYGLDRPDSTSDLSNFALSPCEMKGNVPIFQFTVEKDVSSDKPFDAQRFKKSLIRRLKRMERENLLTTPAPYGFVMGEKELCSLLIFSVQDEGDYISVQVARADEDSYALYVRENGTEANTPNDPDF